MKLINNTRMATPRKPARRKASSPSTSPARALSKAIGRCFDRALEYRHNQFEVPVPQLGQIFRSGPLRSRSFQGLHLKLMPMQARAVASDAEVEHPIALGPTQRSRLTERWPRH